MAKLHYLTKEDIQNLRNQFSEYRTYMRKQSTIARLAKADNVYALINKSLDMLDFHFDLLEDHMSQEALRDVSKNLGSLYEYILKFKGAVEGFEFPAMQDRKNDEAVAGEQADLSEALNDILYLARTQTENMKRIMEREQRDAEENLAQEQRLLDEAESKTLIKGSQEKLRNVAPHSESGYGVLYDTVTECIRIIDADKDLQTLAGPGYQNFKRKFEEWKSDVERYVRNGEFTNPENEDGIVRLYYNTQTFFQNTMGYTQAFVELKGLIENECNNMSEALRRQSGISIRDLVNHNYPVEEQENVRSSMEMEAVTADSEAINSTYFAKAGQNYHDMVALQMFANQIMMNSEPYIHNGRELSGEELRKELKKYETFSFGEITRNGNESTPLLASLVNKGITEEQLIAASKNPDAPENAGIIALMKETRKEILDMAMIDDVKEADDKISDLIVETLVRLEKEIDELIKNPTYENIAKFATSKISTKSFLEQGIPRNSYLENGDTFIRTSVDRKLREAGKLYNFDQVYGIVNTLAWIGERYQHVNTEGAINVPNANVIANQLFRAKNFFHEIAKKPTTDEAIASYTTDFYSQVGTYSVDENASDGNLYFEENKGFMKDTMYKLGFYDTSKFLTTMGIQKDLNGASKRFLKVMNALKDVVYAESHGFKQDYINSYYNDLKLACNEYLDHRNPWSKVGKDRYKLITRINACVDSSRAYRLEVAAKEREANREPDTSFREINNNFCANTKSIFGDSDKMKAIKQIAKEIEYHQLHGMVIPADGGDINWYKLVKACAEYLADPDKRDNARREAVRELMSRAMTVAGDLANDENLSYALEMAAPGQAGNRNEIMAALNGYEAACQEREERIEAQFAAKRESINNENKLIDAMMYHGKSLMRIYTANENNVYVDSIFGLNPQPDPVMKNIGVYTIVEGEEEYRPNEIVLSENAKKGLTALGLEERDFANLAYMEYSVNSYVQDGVYYTEKSDDAAIQVNGMLHENIVGSKFRKNILVSLSNNCNAFKVARTNMVSMLETIGGAEPADLKAMGKLVGQMLKVLKPDLYKYQTLAYAGDQFYIKQIVKMIEKSPQLKAAVLNSDTISKPDYQVLKGIAASAELERDAALARMRIASAAKTGYAMSKQEMKNCYRAILKAGIIWTENKTLNVQHLNDNVAKAQQYTAEYTKNGKLIENMKKELKAQQVVDPNSAEVKALQVKIEEATKESTRLLTLLGVQERTRDVQHPILTFIASRQGKEMYDQIVESMIPKQITMEDLLEKSELSNLFTVKCKAVSMEIALRLEAQKALEAEAMAREKQLQDKAEQIKAAEPKEEPKAGQIKAAEPKEEPKAERNKAAEQNLGL